MTELSAYAPDGLGEVAFGDDLAGLVAGALELADGDVVVVTSKVVSKAEGRLQQGSREDALAAETVRIVARRGPTTIVENRLGLVMAAAGIDASNVPAGRLALLPRDPDGTARRLRAELAQRTGCTVAVVISDTAGRAWRLGQTDLAIGVAGLLPIDVHQGRRDPYGNELAVTAPAVADEIAGLAEVVTGKLGRRPLTRIRGLAGRVLPLGEDGPGAQALQRPVTHDMFALGTREAVEAALRGDRSGFGAPADVDDFLGALNRCGITAGREGTEVVLAARDAASSTVAEALATAHGWRRIAAARFVAGL